MKVKKLHIYGFGSFNDREIALSKQSLHVFAGENEAGKSTIMAFIRAILFGFPTKVQNELRYEPKKGGHYGGKLLLETEQYGVVEVERVKGKATGNVRVYFSDGKVGGETELKQLLGDVDRSIFSGIYSFGLNDLQHMDTLKSEDVNRYLYGVGMTGRHTLVDVEKKVEKQLTSLFKPSGKKPVINEKLQKLAILEDQQQRLKRKMNTYEQLLEKQLEIKDTLKLHEKKKKALSERIHYLDKLQSLAPTVQKKRMYAQQLKNSHEIGEFPENGLERFERLNDQVLTLEDDRSEIKVKIDGLNQKLVGMTVSQQLIELEKEITQLREEGKHYEALVQQRRLLAETIMAEQLELERLETRLGTDQAIITQCDNSFRAEQSIEKLDENEQLLTQRQQLLEEKSRESRGLLEFYEAQVDVLKQKKLDDDVRVRLEEQINNQRSSETLVVQSHFLKERINLLEQRRDDLRGQKLLLTPLVSMIVLVGVAIYLFFTQNELIGLVSVGFSLLLLAMILRNRKRVDKDDRQLEAEVMKIKQEFERLQLDLVPHDDAHHTNEQLLQKDRHVQTELFAKELRLQEETEHYHRLCSELDQLEHEQYQHEQQLLAWCETYSFPVGYSAKQYRNLTILVHEYKQKLGQLKVIVEKEAKIAEEIEKSQKKLNAICEALTVPYDPEQHIRIIERVVHQLLQEKEKQLKLRELSIQKEQLVERLQEIEGKCAHYKAEIVRLFDLANAKNEEDFRQKGTMWVEKQRLRRFIFELESQLEAVVESKDELRKIEGDILKSNGLLDSERSTSSNSLEQLSEEEKQLHEQLAAVTMEMKELAEGTTYSQLLHSIEKHKSDLEETAKQWAFYRAVQFVIQEAKAVYEKERKPKVLKEAEHYFSVLTDDRYKKLFAPIGEERFIVERDDGIQFQVHELSQGTKEQLYLALRLALADVHSKNCRFPLFIDDIFVNFDAKRRANAVRLLQAVAQKHQVIYFTCHPFMAQELTNDVKRL